MRLEVQGGATAHLTYCTNIHPGETWAEVQTALERHLPEVKRRVCPHAPMGVGLRLAAQAAATLSADGGALAWLLGFLRDHSLYAFTINGFPYGRFHGAPVKRQVYEPDWLRPERLAYTNRLAELLAALLPADQPDLAGSVSTVPGGFRSLALDPGAEGEVAEALLRHAAYLVALRERTGRTIALALEPEPMCLLETVEEAAAFFERRLLSRQGVARLAALAGLSIPEAEAAARHHLGLCYDVCHAAVEFEEPEASLARLRTSGIAVAKLQLSSALRLPRAEPAALARLRDFDDGIYLHQVVERLPSGELVRHLDLGEAFAAAGRRRAEVNAGREWRVHANVPVFQEEIVEAFATTPPDLIAMLTAHRRAAVSAHLEVETYTWDVLPPELREADIDTAIARELLWVQGRLA